MKCLESRGFLYYLCMDYSPWAPRLQYLCIFLNSIIIQLQLCTVPVPTLALGLTLLTSVWEQEEEKRGLVVEESSLLTGARWSARLALPFWAHCQWHRPNAQTQGHESLLQEGSRWRTKTGLEPPISQQTKLSRNRDFQNPPNRSLSVLPHLRK